jgi:proteasome assembly chaperone (PAC2) family protein
VGKTPNSKQASGIAALLAVLLSFSTISVANPHIPANDEDTILVDQQPSTKIPYSKIVRAMIHKVFNFDSERIMTFGGKGEGKIARSFSDYVDRTRTRFKVKEDEVELELKLNF